MAQKILILDTPRGNLKELARTFQAAAGGSAEVEVVSQEKKLLERLGSGLPYELVVLDYFLGDGKKKGTGVLRRVRTRDPSVPVVVVAERGDVELAEQAVLMGATDFLVRGGQLEQRVSTLLGKVRTFMEMREENRILGEQNLLLQEAHRARYCIIGESTQIRDVINRIDRVASIPRPVLIAGERGTGKELVARAIHDASKPSGSPFISVNCAALTDTLLESELFGHEKGAFTGATSLAHGKFEQASGGTLFLDEIGNMSLPFQQKILRVVEYGVFTRIGGRNEISTDARIIAATNADLERKMDLGEFLRDLYDRLAFEVIHVPPLREREGDVDILSRHFLNHFISEIPNLGGKRLAQSALQALRRYHFPGNVRELKNIIERAAYHDTTDEITIGDIGLLPGPGRMPAWPGSNFEEKVENFKRQLILDAWKEAGGNQARAARIVGLSYHQFRYYYNRFRDR